MSITADMFGKEIAAHMDHMHGSKDCARLDLLLVRVMLQGVFEFFKAKGHALSPVGLQIMVHGTVPQGAERQSAKTSDQQLSGCSCGRRSIRGWLHMCASGQQPTF